MDISFLNEKIKAYGVTRLKDKIGLSRSHINAIIQGKVEPKLGTLEKILNEFDYELKIVRNNKNKEINKRNINGVGLEMVLSTLKSLEMPVRSNEINTLKISKTELMELVLQYSETSEEVQKVTPLFIYKFSKSILWYDLVKRISNTDLLGYYIDLLLDFTSENKFDDIKSIVLDNLPPEKKLALKYLKSKNDNNKLAEYWGIQTHKNLNVLRQQFVRYI